MTDIFVFGSNLASRHGAGSAQVAFRNHGARYGVGHGLTGNAYAIPTKDRALNSLPLSQIGGYVSIFLDHARAHPQDTFHIVAVGCGLAGYKPEQIAPFFRNAPRNCVLPAEFK